MITPHSTTTRKREKQWRIIVMGDLAMLFDDWGCHRASIYSVTLARKICNLLNAATKTKR